MHTIRLLPALCLKEHSHFAVLQQHPVAVRHVKQTWSVSLEGEPSKIWTWRKPFAEFNTSPTMLANSTHTHPKHNTSDTSHTSDKFLKCFQKRQSRNCLVVNHSHPAASAAITQHGAICNALADSMFEYSMTINTCNTSPQYCSGRIYSSTPHI